jgi:hypothetical protein
MAHSTVVARHMLFAQLGLFAGLFVCFLLIPHFLLESNEGGVSNYGTYLKTVVPYTLGLGICGISTIRAAGTLPAATVSRYLLQWSLRILGLLYLLVLLSTYPYKLNIIFDTIHQYVGVTLVLYMLALSVWLALVFVRGTVNILLLISESVGFLLATATYFNLIHILFIAELLMSAAFGVLLVRTADMLPGV